MKKTGTNGGCGRGNGVRYDLVTLRVTSLTQKSAYARFGPTRITSLAMATKTLSLDIDQDSSSLTPTLYLRLAPRLIAIDCGHHRLEAKNK